MRRLIERGPSPARAYREDPILFLLTLAAAASSIASLLLHLAGIVRMPYTLSFLTVPGVILLLCIRIWAGRAGRHEILARLQAGFVAGLLGLVAYNAARWVVGTLLAVKMSPFYSIYIFGSLITGAGEDSVAAAAFGWAYHISNGITFGIIYALLAGPARWWYGLGWGLVLELTMLLIYPSSSILRPPSLAPFVTTSLISHALFGAVIGIYVQWRLTRSREAL
ncbi:MAG TPA: hypothetical protein DGT23_22805 [Micromonosporaceae bacterium]|nr:hypothetical protein [Micromonosporaceae bacterium]